MVDYSRFDGIEEPEESPSETAFNAACILREEASRLCQSKSPEPQQAINKYREALRVARSAPRQADAKFDGIFMKKGASSVPEAQQRELEHSCLLNMAALHFHQKEHSEAVELASEVPTHKTASLRGSPCTTADLTHLPVLQHRLSKSTPSSVAHGTYEAPREPI